MRKILVAVDLQNDFIDGSLAVPNAADVIPIINAAKHDYDLVYFTLDWHCANHCSFNTNGGPWPPHCIHYTHGAALPDSLLFWRSSTHVIGGLGVVVFFLLIIPSSSPVRLRLIHMELSSLSKGGYRTRANKTVTVFASVYLGLTAAAFLSYWIAGMSAFGAASFSDW